MTRLGPGDVQILDADRGAVAVPVGATVFFQGLGLAVHVAHNSPEFRSQPYVVICTTALEARFAGGQHGADLAIHLDDTTIYDGTALRDPGTDIFDGTATGFGTVAQRTRWKRRRCGRSDP